MECGVWYTQKVGVKEYGMSIINGLSSGLELCIVLIEIGVYLINVAIVLDCVLSELTKVGPEGYHSGVAIKSGQSHDCFVHEGCNYFGFPIDVDFIIFSIGK